jgi:hypothetical protein
MRIVVERRRDSGVDHWQASGGYGPPETALDHRSLGDAERRAESEQRAADLQNGREWVAIRACILNSGEEG